MVKNQGFFINISIFLLKFFIKIDTFLNHIHFLKKKVSDVKLGKKEKISKMYCIAKY